MEPTAANASANGPGVAHTEIADPMSSPAPFLAVVAGIAILVLGGLMATDFIWSTSHPVTIAHTPASTAAPVTTAPATRAPG